MATMDALSEGHLIKVEPDLAKVIRSAAQTPQPFCVVYGIRTLEAERQAVASGHSTTMHSRHLPDKKGLAAAVDLAALIGGKVSWAPGHEAAVFGQIVAQVKAAAIKLNVPVHFGAEWKTFKDWGHVELDWKVYP